MRTLTWIRSTTMVAGSFLAMLICSSVSAADAPAASDTEVQAMNRAMERFAEEYGRLTLDAGRCETALKVADPDWKVVCDRYRIVFEIHLTEAKRLGDWCSVEMKALRARDVALSRNEYDALSYCTVTRDMIGSERFQAVVAQL